MSGGATVTIHRRSRRDEGERQLFVSIDGESVGALGFGRHVSKAVGPGPHRLRIHNTFWWKTVEFDARTGDDLHFSAVNVVPSVMVGVAATLGTAPMFVRIERLSQAEAAELASVDPSPGRPHP
jgi:hypothetical protein